ncbi:uncharacterized protein J3R85_007596 [Psidium guajava]|nr:uncharacterized protein J3R85_007596 [Psidium guajava]
MRLILYNLDILFDGREVANSMSTVVANKIKLGNFNFGKLIVFNDQMTIDNHLLALAVARAQSFCFFDMKTDYDAWFAFTLVFNSTEHKGTLNIMGAGTMFAKPRDLSVVGGMGDFFMMRGIVTVETNIFEGIKFLRLKMAIKLYECY